jgi:hypothetical protein
MKSAPIAAVPDAMPTCRNVSLIPDATPLCSSGTVLSATLASTGLTTPMPTPPRIRPKRMPLQSSPSWMPAMRMRPAAISPSPSARSRRGATLVTAMPDSGAIRNDAMVTGRKRSAAPIGE